MLVHGAGAARSRLFLPGAGADPIWWSRRVLQDLERPEPPKKVVAPQHWSHRYRGHRYSVCRICRHLVFVA